jgi:PAS domain-containing protein
MNDTGVPAIDDPGVVPFGKPVQGKDFSEKHFLNQLTIAFGLLAIVTAVLGLAGIVFGITLIATVYPGYKTISLSAALAWIVLGSVLVINPLLSTEGRAGLFIRTILAGIAIVEAIDIPFNLLGDHFVVETLAVQAGTVFLGASSSPNSPVAEGLITAAAAAMFFMVNGSALVPEHNRTKDAVGVTGIFIMLISLTFVLSYMYGDPFLYGTQFIPIAAVSALAAFFIGAGLVAAAGPSAVPVRYFTGDSTRSRLFRTFIPLTVIIILCENLIFAAISPLFAFSDALRLSASLVLFIFVTILLVARISEGLGRSLELAEQALKLKNDDLRALNDDLKAIEESLRKNVEQITRKERELLEINVALKTEIEEHKRTGLALWESEQRFHLALRNAPVSVAIQDLDLIFRWVYNQNTFTQEDIVGKTDNDLFIPEDAARLIELKRQVIETGKEVHEQIWLTINGYILTCTWNHCGTIQDRSQESA